MKKFAFFMLLVFFLVAGFGSCVTAGSKSFLPAGQQIVAGKEYEVLGRVTGTFRDGHGGFTKLFELAKKEYPDCDDIVNVLVDYKSNKRSTMSALVIKYQ